MRVLLEEVNHRINRLSRDFLVVQWLRLCTSTSGGWSLIPGLKTRILPAHSAAKLWRGLGGNTVSKVHCPLQCGWTSSNPQRAQIQKKKRSRVRLLVEQGHGSALSTLGAQVFKLQPASSASAIWLSSLGATPPTFWVSAYRRQVIRVFSFHHRMSQ